MTSAEKLLKQLKREPTNIDFNDLKKVCESYLENLPNRQLEGQS